MCYGDGKIWDLETMRYRRNAPLMLFNYELRITNYEFLFINNPFH
ncbi:hypothetical protein FDUTEX481_02154 [Tolypothrix sp. PCC 7601]|nr:hypothetical protein FDUTEX481_02154 [Tolypothrix sp. PCC 7601]